MMELEGYADIIVSHAQPDGAVVLYDPSEPRLTVNPYFSNYAVYGLMKAYAATKNPRYLEVSKKWVTWYITEANRYHGIIRDYTGHSGHWTPTNPPYDSVDSYIATFVKMATEVAGYAAQHDSTWTQQLVTFMQTATSILSQVLLTTGPTANLSTNLLSSDTRPITCYTEDNLEVWQAYSDLQPFFATPTLNPKEQAPKTMAAIMTTLFDGGAKPFPRFQIGKSPSGMPDDYPDFVSNYYPGQQTQLIALTRVPVTPAVQSLYANMRDTFYPKLPDPVVTLDDFDQLVWWGLVAMRWEDVQSALFADITRRIKAYNPGVGPFIHDLGHACVFLARLRGFA